ncbi:MAG: hypothetical protein H8D97_01740 [Proteobacteria bacterium]|nr:hypothetical protein [Pseudomonadota bacterium]
MSNIMNLLAKMKVPTASTIIYDNTGTWPTSPQEGQTVFKDQVLYIYATINAVSTWYPLTNTRENYIHTQVVAASTWTVTHNLNSEDFIFLVYDSTGEVIQLASPSSITTSGFELEFTEAVAGKMVMFISSETQTAITLSDMFEKTGDDISVKGNLIPSQDSVWNLGSASKKWADAYISANTIYLGDNTTLSGTGITVAAPAAPTQASEQPTLTGAKLILNSFDYNDGAPQSVNPSIVFDTALTIGDGTQDLEIDCGSNILTLIASNFGVDESGNVTLAGEMDANVIDGGVW